MNPERLLREPEATVQAAFNTSRAGGAPTDDPIPMIRERALTNRQNRVKTQDQDRSAFLSTPINLTTLLRRINQIGQIHNQSGNRVRPVNSPEFQWHNEATNRVNLMTRLSQEGFESLNAQERRAVRDLIRGAINNLPPELRAFFTNRGNPRNRAIDDIAHDPDLRFRLREMLENFSGREDWAQDYVFALPERREDGTWRDQVLGAREQERITNQQANDATQRQNGLNQELNNITNQLAGYLPPIGNAPAGQRYQQIQNLENPPQQGQMSVQARQLQNQILENANAHLQNQIDTIDAHINGTNNAGLIQNLTQQRNAYQNQLLANAQTIQANNPFIRQYNDLIQAREHLRGERTRVQNEIGALGNQLPTLQANHNENTRRLNAARQDRDLEHQGLVNAVNQLLPIAINRTIADRLADAETGRKAMIEEIDKDAPNAAEQAIRNQLMQRWVTRVRRHGITRRPLWVRNQNAIDDDMQTLLTQGPDQLVQNMLRDENIPAFARLQVIRDADRKTTLTQLAVLSLLRRYQESGHRFSLADARRLAENNEIARIIENGRTIEAQVRTRIEQMRTNKELAGPIRNWLATHSDVDVALWTIIAAEVLGIAYLGTPIAVEAARAGITSAGGVIPWITNAVKNISTIAAERAAGVAATAVAAPFAYRGAQRLWRAA